MRSILIFTVLLAAILLASASGPATVRSVGDDDVLKELQDRVDVLEKTVLADPLHPTRTLLSRLDAAEESVDQLQKHDNDTARVLGKDDETLHKALSELQKVSDELNRRLKVAEDHLRRSGAGGAVDLRELKRTLEEVDHSVDDLKERVKRLEAKK